jgi:hypothetical protein
MPSLHIDFPEVVVAASIGTTDTDGTPWDNGVFVIPVCIPLDQAGPWLAAYDPDNDYSPSAADSRIIARAVLDALKKAAEEP